MRIFTSTHNGNVKVGMAISKKHTRSVAIRED